jgi:hypothetical protein
VSERLPVDGREITLHKNELRELVRTGDFILGIYNYCDRWCERCPFTARCLVYATEKADDIDTDPEANDVNSAKFWSRLESMFQEAHEMIAEWAEEAGVDVEAITDEVMAGRDQQKQDAQQHELSLSARRYAEMVQRWFNEEFNVEQPVHDDTGSSKNTEEDLDVSDAIEVIRWYQFFVTAKVFRALMGLEDAAADNTSMADEILVDSEIDDEQERIEFGGDSDADGSAKIALIAIDRSLSAWRVMQSSLSEKADSIRPMLLELERLRRATEQTFPHARDFIRPGFDEVISDFVS